jgi:hypothetical protein
LSTIDGIIGTTTTATMMMMMMMMIASANKPYNRSIDRILGTTTMTTTTTTMMMIASANKPYDPRPRRRSMDPRHRHNDDDRIQKPALKP